MSEILKKINLLTQAQYNAAKLAGTLKEDELYFTPDFLISLGSIADLPVFTGANGLIGTKSVADARAALGVYEKPLRFIDTSVNTSSWNTDSTYADFPRRKTVALTGVTANMVPDVVFAPADAISGNFAPVAVSYAGGIYLYAKAAPGASITIPIITLWKEV